MTDTPTVRETPTAPRHPHGSSCTTAGVLVEVRPRSMDHESLPTENRFAFAYRIRLTNQRGDTVQLLTRHWEIVDAHGRGHEVDGEGVIGQQPILAPGASFEYESWCPLPSRWGTMEGRFTFRAEDDERFDVRVERFYLVAGE